MTLIDRRSLMAALVVACAGGSVAMAQGADAPNVALVKSLYAAFGKGDIATIVAAVAADVDWSVNGRASDVPTFGARKGQAAVQEFFALVASSYTFSEFLPKEFHAVSDKVFVLGRYAMTVKKTGKPAESDWVHIFTIAGGKVTAFREFLDTARAAEAFRG
jgi:ketosteroid isomerase-like protein